MKTFFSCILYFPVRHDIRYSNHDKGAIFLTDELYMQRALRLARKGETTVSPNPMVGAVIVKENRIIGEGYHKKFGGNHAEIDAIFHASESIEGSTIYVTLEPCAHYGKNASLHGSAHRGKTGTGCRRNPRSQPSGFWKGHRHSDPLRH